MAKRQRVCRSLRSPLRCLSRPPGSKGAAHRPRQPGTSVPLHREASDEEGKNQKISPCLPELVSSFAASCSPPSPPSIERYGTKRASTTDASYRGKGLRRGQHAQGDIAKKVSGAFAILPLRRPQSCSRARKILRRATRKSKSGSLTLAHCLPLSGRAIAVRESARTASPKGK